MRAPNWDAELSRQADEAHAARFGFALRDEERAPCPRCGERHYTAVTDLHGAACEGCAERDVEGDVVTSEEGVA